MLRPLRACWAYGSGSHSHAEHARQELMRMLSMLVRNWCVCWAYESGTGACTEHTHQVLMRAQGAFLSENAEHTHQELMRTLSIRVRNWCVCWAYASVPDAYAQHAHQFLTRMLSISIKIPNLKRSLQSMLSMRVRNCCAYAQHAHQKLNKA